MAPLPQYHKRAFFHDYKSTAIYHITLVKQRPVPFFSSVNLQGELALHDLGKRIVYCLFEFFKRHLSLQLYQYVVMPDHVHILIRVREPLPKHLGYYIGNLTGAIGRDWAARTGTEPMRIFEDGYNDRIIGPSRSLDVIFRYIRDNPRRLAVRREHPEYFRRVNSLEVAGRRVRAYGNLFLLHNPFMEQVVVHRADTEEKRQSDRERWLYTAANGGVLVSPFISQAEKALRAEAEAVDGKMILITNEPMPERYKPAARNFELCEAGRLLILSPEDLGPDLTRDTCLSMNALAGEICRD